MKFRNMNQNPLFNIHCWGAASRYVAMAAHFAVAVMMLGGCSSQEVRRESELLVWPSPPALPRIKHETTIYSNRDVTILPENIRFQMMMTGAKLPLIPMSKPYGVAVSKGRMYVTDTLQPSIHVFDFGGKRYFRMGYRFEGKLQLPLGIAADKNGLVYVADSKRKTVVVYDPLGLYQRTIGSESELVQPTSVAISPNADRIYVLDTGGIDTNNHRVVVFDPQGNKLFTFGTRGTDPGNFNLPNDIAVGPDGSVYVLDSGNFRVQIFDPIGKYLNHWGQIGTSLGNFARPRSITVDQSGIIYVTDTQYGNVQLFNREGQLLLFIGENERKDGPMKFSLIAGVTTDELNHIYLVDQAYRKVEILRLLDESEGRSILQSYKEN